MPIWTCRNRQKKVVYWYATPPIGRAGHYDEDGVSLLEGFPTAWGYLWIENKNKNKKPKLRVSQLIRKTSGRLNIDASYLELITERPDLWPTGDVTLVCSSQLKSASLFGFLVFFQRQLVSSTSSNHGRFVITEQSSMTVLIQKKKKTMTVMLIVIIV